MKITISPTHLISHSAGEGVMSTGSALSTASASLVARSSASAAADREQAGGGKERGAVLQRSHDLHVHHPRLAVEHPAHPDLAEHVHARRQAVLAVVGMLQRQRVDRPFDDKERDRDDVDQICAHASSLMPSRRRRTG